ncbi:MAG: M24 family metallopeptidase, partial [Candidatus Heimdallarchaeota archaeon]|nr:M24 family metallopeptidase [Candidatus Heimdallarchaeota archaeon]
TMIKPGVSFKEINDLSIRRITEGLVKYGLLEGEIDDLIEEEKHRRFYMHGLGHWLGIDTHDTGSVSREADLVPGCYFTVEPGIYIPDEEDIPSKYRGIGIRIEDDILVLENGCEVLTNGVVKEIEEIEAMVGTEKVS